MWSDIEADYSFDTGNEWLVTNLSQELSAGLENSSLLEEKIKLELEEPEYDCAALYDSDLNGFFQFGDEIRREQSPSGSSGSETSSLEKSWHSKSDLDTPPVTPPNVVPSETICLISQTDGSLYSLPVANGRHKTSVKAIAARNTAVNVNNDKKCVPITNEEIQQQQVRRKQERMIRNRESAYLSRKRAKEHVQTLEQQVHDLAVENKALKEENAVLKERLGRYEAVPAKRAWRKIPSVPKKTTALLAIAVTVCINLNSLSIFDDVRAGKVSLDPTPTEHHTRSLLWVNTLEDSMLSNLTTSCPVSINHTESLRLERELREWIVGGDSSQNFAPKHFYNQSQRKSSNGRRKRIPRARRVRTFPVDMWGLKPSLLEGLYEAIHRRADTFYLVSFSADHLLLPAVTSNSTNQRPRMSVMLPAFLANSSAAGGGRVEMMQIDCEVTNTQQLSVRGDNIPTHLKPPPRSNRSIPEAESVDAAYVLAEGPSSFLLNLSRSVSKAAAGFQNATAFPNKTVHADFDLSTSIPQSVGKSAPYDEIPLRLPAFLLQQNSSLPRQRNSRGN